MTFLSRPAIWAASSAIAIGLAAAPAFAEGNVANFYKGKQVDLYVGFSAGGGYDLYARILARHMGHHIPGNPNIVVKNRVGAGSVTLTNALYETLPKDGSAFGEIGRGIPTEPLFGNKKAKFDPVKFTWIGSMNNEVSTCVAWHKVPVNTWEDMVTRGMVVGGVGRGTDTDAFPIVLNNVLGTKLRLITGYPGGADINIAYQRGEVEGRCGWSWSSVVSTRAKWLKEKKIKVLIQMATTKHPDLPDVPFVMDLAKTEQDKQVLKLIFSRQLWGRPFLAPPGLPPERAKALKTAFNATMKDAKFLAETKKLKLEINPVTGDEIEKGIKELYSYPKSIVEAAKKALQYEGNIKISKAVIPVETMSGAITSITRGGRRVSFKGPDGKIKKASVSGRNTTIMVAGKEAKRQALKEGLTCKLTFQASAAKKIECN
jgi:tripartite-type tricarboxylate transporter receptor subunit TctC